MLTTPVRQLLVGVAVGTSSRRQLSIVTNSNSFPAVSLKTLLRCTLYHSSVNLSTFIGIHTPVPTAIDTLSNSNSHTDVVNPPKKQDKKHIQFPLLYRTNVLFSKQLHPWIIRNEARNSLVWYMRRTDSIDHYEITTFMMQYDILYGLQQLSGRNLSDAFSLLLGIREFTIHVKSLISVLASKLTKCDDMTGIDIAKCFYALKNLPASGHVREVTDLLKVLLIHMENCKDVVTIHMISHCFYGLQSFSSDNSAVNDIIKALNIKLASFSQPCNSVAIGSLLYGLQNMRCNSEEIQKVLTSVTVILDKYELKFGPRQICNSLYGLNRMTSDNMTVRALLKALCVKMADCNCIYSNVVEISQCFYGLQNMRSNSPEVRGILRILNIKLIQSDCVFNSQGISNCLYGLKSMSSNVQEVSDVLGSLHSKLVNCKEVFNSQAISTSLYGLKTMSSDSSEVKAILQTLSLKITESTDYLTSQSASNSLQGFSRMNCKSSEVRAILRVLHKKIVDSETKLSSQSIAYSICGLKHMNADVDEVRHLLQLIHAQILTSDDDMNDLSICNMTLALARMCIFNPNSQVLNEIIDALTIKVGRMGAAGKVSFQNDTLYSLQHSSCSNHPNLLTLRNTILHHANMRKKKSAPALQSL